MFGVYVKVNIHGFGCFLFRNCCFSFSFMLVVDVDGDNDVNG